jgi:D-alanyl-D-alanine carboxypeptidase/D-alanyl-D-alanine-endopeptidase (penicillin-binding protein 4)
VQEKHPELRAIATGLPVAGVEGSLRNRYHDQQTQLGRGLVRGKTGTLRGVHTLAGYVPGKDGSILVYAFLVNNPKSEVASRVWLDRVSAVLSRCGCS